MALDLLFKFSVTEEVDNENGKELYYQYLVPDEKIIYSFKHTRDRVIFTDRKLITIDIQGFTGSKKEVRIFPYSKITSFSVETAGTFDYDSDFKIWASGIGVFQIKFGPQIDINMIGTFFSTKIL